MGRSNVPTTSGPLDPADSCTDPCAIGRIRVVIGREARISLMPAECRRRPASDPADRAGLALPSPAAAAEPGVRRERQATAHARLDATGDLRTGGARRVGDGAG